MKKQFLPSTILAAALVVGFASAPAFATDDMKKEGMSKMSSDKMEKSGKMDNMTDKRMKKDHMSGKDKTQDGMSK
ncbi:MAG TPA: hypothetical protein VFL51_11075 [Pseudolabrys sp.]|nr:hypothetical protein [Pseudolabrys sp.]